ncbi:CaiB/BaiF CoA-transferase family protein [Marinobacter nanhaiticus D15-8W]|uniref:CoA transferase n=1 Tax=Marinobacter nanhaiticus D15-8W TaxID=626887 RepID=N6WP76_9GAMM|nr:CoA transferase [Marinobacter nanhaiticus]ENO12852.1 CoA transferase [Marinobacter nanhaiticus D15-8W]BES70202.1 CaiB/BaiF CoA-transferase family protein [Marinobacter nanhaiticus D15-8W]
MTAPLHGIRVIDLTAMVSGPLATMMLADQGAEVIKVENPAGGDFTRLAANRQAGFAASYLNNNRNKRSVALNLKEPEGKEALLKLIAGADVFVQNFRPGVIERMGFGEEAVRKVAPDIVYVSISGFGETGPYADRPVYDPLIQGLSGLASVQAGSDERRPQLVRTILPDKLTGVTAAQAITAALFARERTGVAQHVRLSMLDAVIAFLWGSDMGSQTFVQNELPQQEAASFQDLIYETTDGYITVAVQNDREWQALLRALEKEEWAEDPRFLDAELRQQNIDARLELTQSVLRTNTSGYWLARLEAERVPCAPVLTRHQMIRHPQVEATGIVREYEHPEAGRLRQARAAARFSGAELPAPAPAPALGADTRALLGALGYDDATLTDLARRGVIGAINLESNTASDAESDTASEDSE